MKRVLVATLQGLIVSPLVLFALLVGYVPVASASSTSYNPAYLISDKVFTDYSSMTVTQIQNFLISENSGLRYYKDVEDCSSNPSYMARYYTCGKSVPASQIIYDAARAYQINPRSIMATMQKEEALITTPNPAQSQLNCAMGYTEGYPGCAQSPVQGFFNQVDWGTWQFRTYIETMNGVSSWNGLSWSSGYACGSASSLYSAGLYPGNTVTFANPHYSGDPYSTSRPRTVTLANSATAGLYCYTPYVGPYTDTYGYSGTGYSGSFNFVIFFEQAFGSVASVCYNDTNLSGPAPGRKFLSYRYGSGGMPSLAYTQQNSTGSACTEVHVFNSGYKSWATHLATALPASDSSLGTLLGGNFFGGSQGRIAYLLYSGSTGKVEFHLFSSDFQHMPGVYDVATNLPGVTATTGTFVTGDFFGRGYDQVAYILYSGSTGRVEVHLFSSDFRRAVGVYDVATNLPGVTATTGTFVAGDFDGNGRDELAYILYDGSSGKVEVHKFSSDLRRAIGVYDVATNLSGVTADTGTFVAGDFAHLGYDQLYYVLYNGSSGHVETHMFSKDLRRAVGVQDLATVLQGYTAPL